VERAEDEDGSISPANTIEPGSVDCSDEQGRNTADPLVVLRQS
jgi:hypothetical protein